MHRSECVRVCRRRLRDLAPTLSLAACWSLSRDSLTHDSLLRPCVAPAPCAASTGIGPRSVAAFRARRGACKGKSCHEAQQYGLDANARSLGGRVRLAEPVWPRWAPCLGRHGLEKVCSRAALPVLASLLITLGRAFNRFRCLRR